MPRDLDSVTQAQTQSNAVYLGLFCQLQFKTGTSYISTLPCNISWNGQTWIGAGSFGQVGNISEGTDVQAYGTSVTLSGIDPALLADCLNDIQIGLPAVLYMVLFDASANIVGIPTCIFSGQIDKPSIVPDVKTFTITLNLESPMIRLQCGSFRRYTTADQHIDHPGDTGLDWVPSLNFSALLWGN